MVLFFKRIINKIYKNKKYDNFRKNSIYIHPDSKLGKFTTIGFDTRITGPAFIDSKKEAPVIIGKYCAIAHNLRMRSRNHYTGYINLQCNFQNKQGFPSLYATKGSIVIGNNVWIGDNVIILSGVKAGDGAVIGAGSVVTKDVPPYAVAVGNPAKVIKKRFSDEIINSLTKIHWWDWEEEKITKNRAFFETNFSNIEDDFDIDKIIV
jgi:virginiamycin A acetyltransferase